MKKRKTPTRNYGLQQAKRLKRSLQQHASNITVKHVFLFGSVARGDSNDESDIDIAVVCEPFHPSRSKEIVACYQTDRELDTRVELLVLHPEDMANRYLTIAQEVLREGVEV